MRGQLNNRRGVLMFLVALIALLFFAGDHPLLDHWGDVATSSNEEWGSKWIHSDTGGVRYGLWGESASSDARGVFGSATSTSSSGLAIGVYGETDSPTGRGVHGYASGGSGVGKRSSTAFEVLAGASSVATEGDFSYRIVAKRVGFEAERLECQRQS